MGCAMLRYSVQCHTASLSCAPTTPNAYFGAQEMQPELEEAAWALGASPWRTFTDVSGSVAVSVSASSLAKPNMMIQGLAVKCEHVQDMGPPPSKASSKLYPGAVYTRRAPTEYGHMSYWHMDMSSYWRMLMCCRLHAYFVILADACCIYSNCEAGPGQDLGMHWLLASPLHTCEASGHTSP